MKDYLKTYAVKTVNKFQDGGAMPQQGAPQQGAPQGPDVEGMLQEYAQAPSPELAMAICDALVAMMGGGAPQQGSPAPMAKNGMRMGGAPKFRKGGKL
jgi:hypothetical protein